MLMLILSLSLSPLPSQIEDGEIHASLDQVGQMVSFIENPESYDSVVMVQHLDKQLQECMALEKKLTAFDKQLSLEPRYIHRVRVVITGGLKICQLINPPHFR